LLLLLLLLLVLLQSVFNPVMSNAIKKGVVVVKAAGNSGRDGPFNADVATAAGAITLASVGSSVGDPVDKKIIMSRFSSIGPVSGSCMTQRV
jgi:hypothetical protein